MPLKPCTKDGKAGWRWGDNGVCYVGPGARSKALRQGRAIESNNQVVNLTNAGIQIITSNMVGEARRDKLDGREHLVVPVSMIVPGVLHGIGAPGPILYSQKTLSEKPSIWDHMPVVLRHPFDEEGLPLTARDPDILDSIGLGLVFFSVFEDNSLRAEAWLDVQKTNMVDNTIIPRISRGEKMELSTGLGGELIEAPPNSLFNGVAYSYMIQNMAPDHLALLPDEIGACPVSRGCGVNNSGAQSGILDKVKVFFGLNTKVQDKPDGKDKNQMNEVEKKATIDNILANCSCWQASDRPALEKMDDQQLLTLKAHGEREKIANEMSKTNFDKATADQKLADGSVLKFNKATGSWDRQEPAPDPNLIDASGLANLAAGTKVEAVMVGNTRKYRIMNAGESTPAANQPANLKDWMKAQPLEIQSAIGNLMKADETTKKQLIEKLTNRITDAGRKQEYALKLANKSTEELQDLLVFMPAEEVKNPPTYFGANALPGVPLDPSFYNSAMGNVDQNDMLPEPKDDPAIDSKQKDVPAKK